MRNGLGVAVLLILAVAVASGAAKWDLKTGELGLEGKVFSVKTAGKYFIMDVALVALPTGKEQVLSPVRRKTVLVTAGTAFSGVKDLAGVKPGMVLRVAGKDAGQGKPMTAVRVALANGKPAAGAPASTAPATTPGTSAASGGLGPWEALIGGEPGKTQPIEILDLKTGATRPTPGAAVTGERPRIAPDRATYHFWQGLAETPKLLAGWIGKPPRVMRLWPKGTESADSCWSADGKAIYAAQSAKTFDLNGFFLAVVPFPGGLPQMVQLVNNPFEGVSTIVHEMAALRSPAVVLATNHNWHEMISLQPPSGAGKRVTTFSDWDEAQLGVRKGVVMPEPFNPRQDRATGKVYFALSYLASQLESETGPQAKAARKRLGIFSMQPDGSGIARVPIDSKEMPDGSVRQPFLVDVSPDGKTLLMTYWKTPGLYTVPAAGGTPAPVPGKGKTLSEASWSG